MPSVIMWFRNDLRLNDNPALSAAVASGRQVIPLYILDDVSPGAWTMGGASRWWLHHSLTALDNSLRQRGFGPLVILRGNAEEQISRFAAANDTEAVHWNRCYEPWAIARDSRIKETLGKDRTHSHASFLLFEPLDIQNKTGGPYKVFTPFSRTVLEKQQNILPPENKVIRAQTPAHKLQSDITLNDLGLLPRIPWDKGLADTWTPGEAGAQARLAHVVDCVAEAYKAQRDFPGIEGVSRLSPHLHFGEISPRQIWHAVRQHTHNAESFLRQLIWRDFSWHMLYYDPHLPDREWAPQFRGFPWRTDKKLLKAWQRGETGIPIIDAGMRQLWQTGWMHNRVRMLVGSLLVKNLLIDWREGEKWFWDTLVDADLGNNAAGWQWVAGCGADAAPYFRVFNPVLQSKKFDPQASYIRTYLPELRDVPDAYIHAPWEAPPIEKSGWRIKYPTMPIVDLSASRGLALAAYASTRGEKE